MRSARSGWRPGVVLERRGVAEVGAARASVPYRRPWTPQPSRCAPTSPWSAPAPPGSTPRSWPPREGARVALVSRSPLGAVRELLGPGRDRRRARPTTTRPSCTPRTRSRAGRDAARASAVEVLCEESPGRVRDLRDAGRAASTPTATATSRSAWRAATRSGGSCTRAAPPPGRRITRELSALVATHERIEVLEPLAAAALATHDGRCVGLSPRGRDDGAAGVIARAR